MHRRTQGTDGEEVTDRKPDAEDRHCPARSVHTTFLSRCSLPRGHWHMLQAALRGRPGAVHASLRPSIRPVSRWLCPTLPPAPAGLRYDLTPDTIPPDVHDFEAGRHHALLRAAVDVRAEDAAGERAQPVEQLAQDAVGRTNVLQHEDRSGGAHDAPHLLEPADGIPDGAEYTGGRNRLEGPVPKWEGFGGCPDEPHPAADLLPPAPGAHQHPRRNVHGRELHAFAVQREVAAGADSDLEGPAARSCDHTATTRLAAHRLHRRRKPVVERRDAVVDWCHGKINRPQKNHRTSPSRRLPRRAYAVPRPPTNP